MARNLSTEPCYPVQIKLAQAGWTSGANLTVDSTIFELCVVL